MTRQRYSTREALNRILLLLEGKPVSTDAPGTIPGSVLSENDAISDIAELLANSLPDEVPTPLGAFARYGQMFANNVTGTVSVAQANVMYAVSGSITSGLLNGFTFSNVMHLRPTYSGRYLINYSISVRSASANQEMESGILIDSAFQTGSSAHAEAVSVNKANDLSGTMIVDVVANSRIGLGLSNHTGGNNLIFEHLNMSALLIAPYGG